MYLNEAIKNLFNKYDKKAFESLDNLSKNYSYKLGELSTSVLNINEAFDKFNLYIEGYIDYKIEALNTKENVMNQKQITEATHDFIDNKLFTENRILYTDIKNYIESYISGVNKLINTIDKGREKLFEADVDNTSIGAMEEFGEYFIDKLNTKFFPVLENMLWASGYYSQKKLKENNNQNKFTFL